MPRYLLSEFSSPLNNDYYYEANYYTSDQCYIKMHTHSYYEFYLFMRDGAKLQIGSNIYTLNRGMIAIIPPNIRHTMVSDENSPLVYEKYYLWITEHALNTFIFNEHSLLSLLHKAIKKELYTVQIESEDDICLIRDNFMAIANSKKTDPSLYGIELMNRSHVLSSIVTINRYILKNINPLHNTNKNPKIVNKITQYINDNFASNISLDSIETALHMNKYSLSKIFKEHTQSTIHNYITKQRIEHSKSLMLSGIIPTKVYSFCGYTNYTSYFRSFTKTESMTPSQFIEANNILH